VNTDALWAEYNRLTAKLARGLTKGQGADGVEAARRSVYARLVLAGAAPKLAPKYRDGKQLKQVGRGGGKK
jgi:hypothetical protein